MAFIIGTIYGVLIGLIIIILFTIKNTEQGKD
jgi:uncharacterized membrane protein YccC